MSTTSDMAAATFKEGFNCAQAVLCAFSEKFGLDRTDAMRVAGGFGGGMGRSGATCGAVTGGIMVLGLRYGQTTAGDKAAKEKAYAQVRLFLARFAERMGSVECRALVGYDISTPEGHEQAARAGVFQVICPKAIGVAVDILETMV